MACAVLERMSGFEALLVTIAFELFEACFSFLFHFSFFDPLLMPLSLLSSCGIVGCLHVVFFHFCSSQLLDRVKITQMVPALSRGGSSLSLLSSRTE